MKKISFLLASIILLLTAAMAYITKAEDAPLSDEVREVIKDETVYANLNHDGSISAVNVVNRLETPESGIYADTGTYERILNLTGSEVPEVSGNRISWQLPARSQGFYWQGTVKNARLPFKFDIKYRLDGREVNPEDAAGKSGRVEILLEVASNKEADAYFTENYLCQVQFPLNIDLCSNISAEGASTMLVGRTLTLLYMVLPGRNARFTIGFDASRFELDSATINCTYFDPSELVNINTGELFEEITQMSQGTGEIITGTNELKSGLIELNQGISELASGADQLKEGAASLKNGVEGYAAGADALAANAKLIDDGISQLSAQGAQLTNGYDQLLQGISQMIQGFSPVLEMLPEAQQQEYLGQLQALAEQLNAFGGGLDSYAAGVSRMDDGIGSLTKGIEQFAVEGKALAGGAAPIQEGIEGLAEGLSQISENTALLPEQIQLLIDGQKKLKNGIDEAANMMNTFSGGSKENTRPVSFVSDAVSPRSVQFVIMTPSIKEKAEDSDLPKESREEISLWERIIRLFKK